MSTIEGFHCTPYKVLFPIILSPSSPGMAYVAGLLLMYMSEEVYTMQFCFRFSKKAETINFRSTRISVGSQ